METSSQIDKNTLLNEIVSYTKERVETYISNYSKYKEDYENLKIEIMNLSVFKELLHEHETLKSKQDKYKDSEEVVNTISNLNAFSKIITENAKLKEELKKYKEKETKIVELIPEKLSKERITLSINEKNGNNISENIKLLQQKYNLSNSNDVIKQNILPSDSACSVKKVVTVEEEENVYYQEYKCNTCNYQTHNDDPDCSSCEKTSCMYAVTKDEEEDEEEEEEEEEEDEEEDEEENEDEEDEDEEEELCKNEDCSAEKNDEYDEKCNICPGYYKDDGLNDILFIKEEPNNKKASCDLCKETDNIVQMKGTGQYICQNACDEQEAQEEEEE